jgi:hypothetical protein
VFYCNRRQWQLIPCDRPVIIVSLRTYTRAIILHNIGKDDYAMFAALLFTLGYLVAIFVLRENGMGFRGAEVTFVQATTTLQVTYAIEILYYLCVNAIKISIVLFYLRIGKSSWYTHNMCTLTPQQPSKNHSNASAKPPSSSSSPSAPSASSSS